MILHSRKIVFVHIAKNAGMWVTAVLRHHARKGDVELSGPDCRVFGRSAQTEITNVVRRLRRTMGVEQLFKHSTAREIRAAYPREWNTYATLAVVRDPLARAMSMLRYARSAPALPADGALRKVFLELRDTDDVSNFILDGRFESAMKLRFFKPQIEYITDQNGAPMVQHVISVERLAHELGALVAVPRNLADRIVNESRHADRFTDLQPKALAQLAALYAVDARFAFSAD